MDHRAKLRLTYGLLIIGSLAVSLFCLVYPVYVIRPFRHQGVRELQAALLVVRFRPAVVALAVAAAVVAAILCWRAQTRMLWRIAATLGAVGVAIFAGLSRINIYELMFHPIGRPAFVAAGEAKLDGDEKVIAVDIGGSARAYPIRIISYHHIVNDALGGVPIVATY